jgi:hypothetical protein
MKRYVVRFIESRLYEMTVEAGSEEEAIKLAQHGPENPIWLSAELDGFAVVEIERGAP